jgi:hypothetical protein
MSASEIIHADQGGELLTNDINHEYQDIDILWISPGLYYHSHNNFPENHQLVGTGYPLFRSGCRIAYKAGDRGVEEEAVNQGKMRSRRILSPSLFYCVKHWVMEKSPKKISPGRSKLITGSQS